jgi:DNA-binding MarR family transcriptional regulator
MADVPWLEPDEMRAWTGYRRMRGLLDQQIARDLARDSGLSDADYHVLSTLSETREVDWRLKALADRLLWSPSRLSHQLSRMQKRGLVERPPAGDDPLGARISLTAKGLDTIVAAAPGHVRSVRLHFIDVLTDEQLAALTDITETVLRRLGSPAADVPADTASRPAP